MEVKVELNNLRTAPRKTRQVADVIRNKNLAQARALLEFTIKRPADPMLKLLNSAAASAVNDLKLKEDDLYISKVTVDEGPKLKRWHAMSRGRAYPILKRTSNIILVLSDGHSEKKEKKEIRKEVKPKVKSKNRKSKIVNHKS
ncbi:MAG: 50S ribosomal protein L22 [Candidatus Staskawiczbacteria bacterium RIFCSPHIGHO2_12_FULL_38_11]|uniref:Large ribosomal subunit protein uL22 n=1 Tax=Candidatus Staskawiczbacteria bacterium RIFCSPHIGHO2_12_FULL_38_11 TaxID=1802209 RepID=A0A1G2I791_9BACT|nr:MAG: 50S ribosomal protein L22 [Candidatus Staskawiczbacteria bacterium RIFCSPHIGHO2_12_FULL_38_11]